MTWKLPPKEKVYEALSVLADDRYEFTDPGQAIVTSSGGDKKYKVTWTVTDGTLRINSDDNASRWQGYTGYPIIAILLGTGYINYNTDVLKYLKKIPWNNLNKLHRNNYAAAVEEVLLPLDAPVKEWIRNEITQIFNQLSGMNLIR